MCKLCTVDGFTRRHTMPWLREEIEPPEYDPEDPASRRYHKHTARLDAKPDPIPHPSLSAIRSHKRKSEDLCPVCREFYEADQGRVYLRAYREDALTKIEDRLAGKKEGMDAQERRYYERRQAKLRQQLFGEELPKPEPKPVEPVTQVNVRLPDRIIAALKERTRKKGTSFSAMIRTALDEWLVL